jgi:carbon monoxide dehydrogenase subunit G
MEMTGQQRIAAAPQRVWDALLDPAIMKECIPGCQSLDKDGDRMRAVVAIKIGPISAKFAGAISLTEQEPPRSCRIVAEGQGGNAGFAKGEAKVKLEGQDGATVLTYTVDAQVSGRLAQVGGALIDATAKRLAASFFKRFGELIDVQMAGPAPATAPVIVPPSASGQTAPAGVPPVVDVPARKSAGTPVAWILAVAVAAIVGFLIGRGQGSGSDWMGIAVGLLLMVVAAAGFLVGKGAAAPVVILDAAQVARLLRERGP